MEETKSRTRILKNGAVYDEDKGRIIAMRPELATKNTQITAENTGEYRRQRQEKTQAALRERILDVTRKHSDLPLSDSAEAVAEAGAFLWDEIVLGEDIYPRDRLEAWERLGRHAGILSTARDEAAQTPADAVQGILHEVAAIAAALAATQRDMIGGQSGDIIDIISNDAGDDAADRAGSEAGGEGGEQE